MSSHTRCEEDENAVSASKRPVGPVQYAPNHVSVLRDSGHAVGSGSLCARYLEVQGTLVFGDISGFTALSERLASRGRIGAELLNQLLTISFSPILDLVEGLGGDLVSFGGDALCLLFTGDEHAHRAVAAAHGLRASLRRTASQRAPIDRGTLRVSTGVHSGRVVVGLVGVHSPMMVTIGPTLTRTLALEQAAVSSEILLSNETRQLLGDAVNTWAELEARLLGEGESVWNLAKINRAKMPWLRTAESSVEIRAHSVERADLIDGVDEPIAIELRAGRAELTHRPATLTFIHYEHVDHLVNDKGAASAVSAVHQLMDVIQTAARREQLTIISTDVDQDGGKVILAAGLPRSQGLEFDRTLAAVRSILDADQSLPIKVGVHAGTVFAGPVGSTKRSVFTVIGDVVNTTARIMARSVDGEALISPLVLDGSHTSWNAAPITPFAAKGKSKPLQASVLGSPRTSALRLNGPTRLMFAGRADELQRIETVISEFAQRNRRLVELVGEGGLGKSRLLEETLFRLASNRIIQINGSPFARTQGYFALQSELRVACGLPEGESCADELREVVKSVHPEIEPMLPLFGAAFGCKFPETSQSRQVSEAFRSRVTNRLVGELLERVCGRTGVVLVVDDSHWVDEATCSLLRSLIDNEDLRWLYLVARRPEPSYLDLTEDENVLRLALTQLDEASAMSLVEEFTKKVPLADEVMHQAVARASGNPLLLELVLEALESGAAITDLPEEAERLVAARLDALGPESLELLRAASVLGMDVSAPLLASVLGETTESSDQKVAAVSEYLIPESIGAFRFRHALVRDTAYEGLSFATRRRLHATVVDAIEAGVQHVGETVSLLAIHASAAGLHEQTWRYAREAADLARQRGLLTQSADLLNATIAAARFVPTATESATGELFERLGDIELLAGRPDEAHKAFVKALKRLQVEHDLPNQVARLLNKRAETHVALQKYGAANALLDKGLSLIAEDRTVAGNRLRAEMLTVKAGVRFRRGQNAGAIRLLNEAWAAAERADDNTIRARINYLHGAIESSSGSRHAEFYINEAVQLLRATGRRVELAKALGNLGYFEHFNGRWTLALQHYEESARVAEACGDNGTAANARNNIGEVLSDQGDLDEAERKFLAAQRVWTMAKFSIGQALALSNLGRVAVRRGEFDRARSLYEEAIQRFVASGASSWIEETNARQAECEYAAGNHKTALAKAEPLLKAVHAGGQNPALESLLLRVIGCCYAALGDIDAAMSNLLHGLSLAEAFRCRHDQLLIIQALDALGEQSPEQQLMLRQLHQSLALV